MNQEALKQAASLQEKIRILDIFIEGLERYENSNSELTFTFEWDGWCPGMHGSTKIRLNAEERAQFMATTIWRKRSAWEQQLKDAVKAIND